MVNCNSCGKKVLEYTILKCPNCDRKIYRCDNCREMVVPYKCECGFEGP